MNLGDDMKNKAQELSGKTKEFVGEKTDNPGLERDGANDKAEAGVRQAGEHAKDAINDVKDGFTKN